MTITIKDFQDRMKSTEYQDKVMKNWKSKKQMQNYLNQLCITKQGENMGLELKKPDNKYNLTEQQRELLDKIINDKYSVGSFAGMIFNNLSDKTTIDNLIKQALDVRLKMKEMLE